MRDRLQRKGHALEPGVMQNFAIDQLGGLPQATSLAFSECLGTNVRAASLVCHVD